MNSCAEASRSGLDAAELLRRARERYQGEPLVLVDTAGLRDSADPIEMEGMRRARARIAAADTETLRRIEATRVEMETF